MAGKSYGTPVPGVYRTAVWRPEGSEKWWDLEKRVKEDKRSRGVIADMARSRMPQHIAALLIEGVITEDDLDGFSDDLRAWAAAAARDPGGSDRI